MDLEVGVQAVEEGKYVVLDVEEAMGVVGYYCEVVVEERIQGELTADGHPHMAVVVAVVVAAAGAVADVAVVAAAAVDDDGVVVDVGEHMDIVQRVEAPPYRVGLILDRLVGWACT